MMPLDDERGIRIAIGLAVVALGLLIVGAFYV